MNQFADLGIIFSSCSGKEKQVLNIIKQELSRFQLLKSFKIGDPPFGGLQYFVLL
jgi:hypothetical protein